jgi:hypothetical protein
MDARRSSGGARGEGESLPYPLLSFVPPPIPMGNGAGSTPQA